MRVPTVADRVANMFLHYTFDLWMTRTHSDLPWCRYADDGLVHCRSEQEAQALKVELQARLAECRLELHPTKTKVVYCKDRSCRERIRTSNSISRILLSTTTVQEVAGQHTVLRLQPSGQFLGAESHALDDPGLEHPTSNAAVVGRCRPADQSLLRTTTHHRRCIPCSDTSILRFGTG